MYIALRVNFYIKLYHIPLARKSVGYRFIVIWFNYKVYTLLLELPITGI